MEDTSSQLELYIRQYQALAARNASRQERLEALTVLLAEEYLEPYMTEYGALALLLGDESAARRMLRKQLRLFPGGAYEEQAQALLENEGEAEAVLARLEAGRSAATDERGGTPPSPAPAPAAAPQAAPPPAAPLSAEVTRYFENIVGMEQAKAVLQAVFVANGYQSKRADFDLQTRKRVHFLIRGGPGSGKTLLSNQIQSFLVALGYAKEGPPALVQEASLADLLAGDGGELEKALRDRCGQTVVFDGLGELFSDPDTPSRPPALLCAVLKRLEEQMNFILLGDKRDLDHLLTLEPTLAGMFLYDITLPPYSPDELVSIGKAIARQKGYTLSTGACEKLAALLESQYRSPAFRGGKTLEAMIGRATVHLAQRIQTMEVVSKGKLMRIEAEDLESDGGGESLEALLGRLDALTGLASVKEQVHRLTALAKANREARRLNLPTAGFGTLHTIYAGNAGTGKTTVARIVGGIYKALGILPQGDKLVEVGRADLVAGYVGQTAPKVIAKVDEAMGGVLFIDEAYALSQGSKDSFGQEAIDTLVAQIENHRADFMVILAGYSQDMDKFLSTNQGLASRFPNRMEFADYTQAEMEDIFQGMLRGAGKRLADGCESLLSEYIAENRKKKGFGNARGIRNLRDKLIEVQSLRLTRRMEGGEQLTAEDFAQITQEDLGALVEKPAAKKSLEEQLDQLRAMTGLSSVKAQVEQMVYTTLAKQRMRQANMGMAEEQGTLHMVFRGNAGTGKTTVARIIAGIYNTLGLLPNGDTFIECSRSQLVAGYLGQTAEKTRKVVESALGGVLFIDEAYSLCRGDDDSFGREAVDTLIAEMENHRKELMVILAGYSEDMDRFFAVNQGMTSRVPVSLTFEDYTQEELLLIFQGIIKGKGFTLADGVLEAASRIIAQRSKTPGFGNARGVRNIAENIISLHQARLGTMLSRGQEPVQEDYTTISAQDLPPQ